MAAQESKTSYAGGGVNFLGLLTSLFVGLKLTNHIDWSWWWVLAPLWLPLSVFVFVLSLILLIVWLDERTKFRP